MAAKIFIKGCMCLYSCRLCTPV